MLRASRGRRLTLVYHTAPEGESRLEVDGKPLTGSENAFAFRVSWASTTNFFYTSDGKIRKRSITGSEAQTVEFKATLQVNPARYRSEEHTSELQSLRHLVCR